MTGRRIIAVCTSWEDEENLNLVLNRLIESTESQPFLPLCVTFDRNSIESRGEESIREFMSAFSVPNLAGFLLFGEMIRSDEINQHIIHLAQKKKLPDSSRNRAVFSQCKKGQHISAGILPMHSNSEIYQMY